MIRRTLSFFFVALVLLVSAGCRKEPRSSLMQLDMELRLLAEVASASVVELYSLPDSAMLRRWSVTLSWWGKRTSW